MMLIALQGLIELYSFVTFPVISLLFIKGGVNKQFFYKVNRHFYVVDSIYWYKYSLYGCSSSLFKWWTTCILD